jgi:hypothetical protein
MLLNFKQQLLKLIFSQKISNFHQHYLGFNKKSEDLNFGW